MATPLATTMFPVATGTARLTRSALLLVGGVALLTLSAKIQVPFWPVPLSMQTFAVLLIGLAYGRGLGAATVGTYLAAGAAGLPIFVGPVAGPGYFMGPTGGYLLGFLAAALLMGEAAARGFDRRVSTTVASLVVGNLAIYACGVAWLGFVIGSHTQAVTVGVVPFLTGDVLKIALAAAVLPGAWALLGRR